MKQASFWQTLWHNPIITKELRHRMRGWQGILGLAFCITMLGGLAVIAYATIANDSFEYRDYYQTYSSRSQQLGTNYFMVVFIGQLLLIGFLTPVFSAATLAGEKQRQTYEVLLVTLLKPRDIVLGKLLSALAYSLLITIAGLPIASIAFVMGGVAIDQLVIAIVIMLATSFLLGTIGVFWSSFCRTAMVAGIATYINLGIFLFVIPLGIYIGTQLIYRLISTNYSYFGDITYGDTIGRDIMSWICSVNPIYAIFATDSILKYRADSNILFYGNWAGDWNLTPFLRFLIIASLLSLVYLKFSIQNITPLDNFKKRSKKAT